MSKPSFIPYRALTKEEETCLGVRSALSLLRLTGNNDPEIREAKTWLAEWLDHHDPNWPR